MDNSFDSQPQKRSQSDNQNWFQWGRYEFLEEDYRTKILLILVHHELTILYEESLNNLNNNYSNRDKKQKMGQNLSRNSQSPQEIDPAKFDSLNI